MDSKAVVAIMISVFLAVLLGSVFLSPLSTVIAGTTVKSTVVNESIDMSTAKNVGGLNSSITFNLAQLPTDAHRLETTECLPGSTDNTALVTLYNQSGVAVTRDTDYNLTDIGVLSFYNTDVVNQSGNTSTISYSYCQDGYLSTSWHRNVLNTSAGFYALAVFLASLAGMGWWLYKNYFE